MTLGSKDVARAALHLALTPSREEEKKRIEELEKNGLQAAAVDFGGDYLQSIAKIVEHAIVAAKRQGVIAANHSEEGAIAGATREALAQIAQKAMGLPVGGKLGIARYSDHLAVGVFLSIGLLHLNETGAAVAHRTIH